MLPAEQMDTLRIALTDPGAFSRALIGRPLRPYQLDAARAIAQAAIRGPRDIRTVMMARQAGKNELSAHVEAYLMTLFARRGGSIVKAAPTFKPQLVTSMLRLKHTLGSPLLGRPTNSWGYMIGLGKAVTTFLSAEPNANVVGATASIAIEFDEAQDIDPEKHDRDFAPMAASTNAPRIYYGTAWRDDDLLQAAKAEALDLQRQDGIRRHFEYPWEAVAEWNPAYGEFVRSERRRLGESHPTFLTQYALIPVATVDSLLNQQQLAALHGDHPREDGPDDGSFYVAGIDLGGPAEADPKELENAREHDATAITIGKVTLAGPLPAVQIVRHYTWTGASHAEQYDNLAQLIADWRCQKVAVDATGLGSPTAEFLVRAFGEDRVEPFVFTSKSKSELAYDTLSWINGGRLKHYADDDEAGQLFFAQAKAIRREMHQSRIMSWENPKGHDDIFVSACLCGHAALSSPPPAEESVIVTPTRVYGEDQGRFA